MGNCEGCLGQTWKTGIPFSEKGKKEVLKHIFDSWSDIPEEISKVNIMMIGNMSSGKSSFTNTLRTALKKDCRHIDTTAVVYGQHHESVTSQLHKVNLYNGPDGKILQVFDCRGFPRQCGQQSAFVKDLEKAVMGYIKDNYQFMEKTEIDANSPYFRENPTISDRMHCVLFVIKATDFLQETANYEVMNALRTFLEKHRIPLRIVLTAVDRLNLCKSHPQLKYIYWSKVVKEKVETAGYTFCLRNAYILPIANYVNETEPTITTDVLALEALDNILQQAVFFIKDNVL
ncbi:interferon-induced protein 44-like [Crassostrea virginica]